jgi:hypothetical protein
MRKIIILAILFSALGAARPTQALAPPVIYLPFRGEGSAQVTLGFAPSEVRVPPPDEVRVSARAEGNLLHISVRDLVGLGEEREVSVLALGRLRSATRIPIRLIPAAAEAMQLYIPSGGAIITQVELPFLIRHALAPAPPGLEVMKEIGGYRLNITIKDNLGLTAPLVMYVFAYGDDEAFVRVPILLLPYHVTGDDWGDFAPLGALGTGFTPAARAMTLNLGASGTTTFTLELPPGPFTLQASSSANYSVVLTPTSGTSTGAPFVVTATVTALGGTSNFITLSALSTYAYIILTVNEPAFSLTPSTLNEGILTTRTFNLVLHNPSGFLKSVEMVWMHNPAWLVSGTITSTLVQPTTSLTLPVTITCIPALGKAMSMVVHAATSDGELRTVTYQFAVREGFIPIASHPGPNAIDAYEPDDSCSQFSTIQFGAAKQQSRTLHAPSNIDVVRYILPPNSTHAVQIRGTGYNAEPVLRVHYDICSTAPSGGYAVITSTMNMTAGVALPNPYNVSRNIYFVVTNNKPYGPGTDYVLRVLTP